MSHLVQRLEDASNKQWVSPYGGNANTSYQLMSAGAGVDLDYMGNAQFEYGASEKSLDRMLRTAGQLRLVTRRLVRPTYEEPAYLVVPGDDAAAQKAITRWEQWSRHPHTMEATGYFQDLPQDAVHTSLPIVGWWDIEDDIMWARNPEVAIHMFGALARLAVAHEVYEP